MSSCQGAFPEQLWSVGPPVCLGSVPALGQPQNVVRASGSTHSISMGTANFPSQDSSEWSPSGAVQKGWELAKVPLLAKLPCRIIRKINSTCIYFLLPLVWWWNTSKMFPISRNWFAVQQQLLKDIGWYLKYYFCINQSIGPLQEWFQAPVLLLLWITL